MNEHDAETMLGGDFPCFGEPDRNRPPNEGRTSSGWPSPAGGLQERQWKLRLFIERKSFRNSVFGPDPVK